MLKTKIILIMLLCVLSQMVMAQGRVISGSVEDALGPVMMANVVERDGNNRIVSATQTDMMGNFSMEIKNPKNKLVVSYVGSKTVIVDIGDKETFSIKLEDEKTTLSEVTVVSRRSNSGGLNIPKSEISVSQQTFNLSDVEGLSFTSADEALQGEIAGLDIVSNSGNLGAGTTMRLRGVTTINGNAEPLIVVDDKIFDNPDESFDFANATEEEYSSLLSVNVEDIASITVLKDAAATAVWGANGANGVIMITTKRGSRGKPKVNFSYKLKGKWNPKGYSILNGDDYTMMIKEEYYNPNQSPTATANIREINYDTSWAEFENWNNNTDWVDAVEQFGLEHSWNLNISGGGQKATFRISGGFDKQVGQIIKQNLDRLTTRLVLDYNVSDRIRFSTNFALTYTNNEQNYAGLLGIALKLAPNMAIYRQDANGNDTGDYYIMNPMGNMDKANPLNPYTGEYSSYELRSIRGLGNPVAIGNLAWKKDKTYRITPDFSIKYELLGMGADKHRLTFNGRVDFDIYARSQPAYAPAALSTVLWNDPMNYNASENSESNRLKIGARGEFIFTPHFSNEDLSLTMLARYEMSTQRSNSQYVRQYSLPTGITDPTVDAALLYTSSKDGLSSGSGKANSQNLLYNAHFSYKGRYNLGFSLRADGNSKFGPKQKWGYFPGVSLRYNVSDEPFFKPLKSVASMLGLRASWSIVGKAPDSDYLFYNTYSTGSSPYGSTASMDGLRLDDLRWEKTQSINLGFNIGFLNDMIEVDFDYYHKKTNDLLQKSVTIPSITGYSSIKYSNVGAMTNDGWEMNINAKNIIKAGKFSFSAGFNIAQNYNEIKEMDKRVLDAYNSEWIATSRGGFQNRVQVGNPLGSIYGFRYKGVYKYSYDYLQNYNRQMETSGKWRSGDGQYENWINELLKDNTAPVVRDVNGKVVMNSDNSPRRMVYNYVDGTSGSTYEFQGGDAIYEDINHDGQINSLDIVYLGNSQPKMNGGFNLTFNYGPWQLKARFNYRWGNKIINAARRDLESMSSAYNQASSVNWRWRKDGDETMMPRAIYVYDSNSAYNYQGSDRYVEDGSFLRLNNLQISYKFPTKTIKKWGLSELRLYGSLDNVFCWTKYSGIDPEINPGGWGLAVDNANTPRPKQFTATISVGF